MGPASALAGAGRVEQRPLAADSLTAVTSRLNVEHLKHLSDLLGRLDSIADYIREPAPEPAQPPSGHNPAIAHLEDNKPPVHLVGSLSYAEKRLEGMLGDMEVMLQRIENNLGL